MKMQGHDDDDDDDWLASSHYAGGLKQAPRRELRMPRSGCTLSIEQRPPADAASLWATGGGAVLWEAAEHVVTLLDATFAPDGLSDQRCVDVSAGSGACGLACAALGAQRTMLTDLPEALPLLRANAAASAWAERLEVHELRWADAPPPPSCADAALCVCVDCIYQPEHYAALAATLARLCARRYLLAWAPRERGEEAFVARLVDEHGFVVDDEATEASTAVLAGAVDAQSRGVRAVWLTLSGAPT